MKCKTFILFILAVLTFNLVSASMPVVHEGIDQTSLSTYSGSSTDAYESCVAYPDLCFVGNQLTDFSVAYYYVSGETGVRGEKYSITHSPGFATSMLDNAVGTAGIATIEEERACAWGSAIHQAEDHPVHTIMVPWTIRHTGLPNSIIHVLAEQHQANIFLKENSELRGKIIETLSEESWNKCIPLLKRTLQGYNEYEEDLAEGKTDDLLNYFIAEVTNSVDPNSKTNYEIAFRSKVSLFGRIGLVPAGFLLGYLGFMFSFTLLFILLIFKKQKRWHNYLSMILFLIPAILLWILFISLLTGNAFATLIWIVKPVSNIVPIGSYDSIIEKQISNVHQLFIQGEPFLAKVDRPIIASGFTELNQADKDVRIISYIWFLIPTAFLIFLIWANFKKQKTKKNQFQL